MRCRSSGVALQMRPASYSVGHPADVDDGLGEVVEPTGVGEHKRDRPNTSHAGYDNHTGHDLGACGHFHADRHLDFRRRLMPAIIRLRARSGDHRQPAIIQQANARGAHDARPLGSYGFTAPAAGGTAQARPCFGSTSSE